MRSCQLVLGEACRLEVAAEEVVRRGHRQVELQCVEHDLLHGQDLFLGVGAVTDVDKVPHLRHSRHGMSVRWPTLLNKFAGCTGCENVFYV